MKIVINRAFGGFGLSELGRQKLAELKGIPNEYGPHDDFKRTDADLITVVRVLGDKANGDYAKLRIVDIPDDVEWIISEHDGQETVEEKHRSWS